MSELLHGLPGNAASMHRLGAAARDCLEQARERFRQHLGGTARILFTSGATEGNGLCLLGALRSPVNRCEQLVLSELEHSSVYDYLEFPMERPVLACKALTEGIPDLDHLEYLVSARRSLVSMMHVNNETGAISPIAEIASIVHRHGGLLHVDAAQSVGKMPLDDVCRHADALTLSAHKFHGPLGVGAIAILHPEFQLAPIFAGGRQEGGVRGGTVNVPAIAAAAVALDEAVSTPGPGLELRHRLEMFVEQHVPDCLVVARRGSRLWTTSYICFPGLLQSDLIDALSARDVHAGTGAACNSAHHESRVLRNMGIEPLYNQGGVRFSFSLRTPAYAVQRLVQIFPEAYAAAMERSPYL